MININISQSTVFNKEIKKQVDIVEKNSTKEIEETKINKGQNLKTLISSLFQNLSTKSTSKNSIVDILFTNKELFDTKDMKQNLKTTFELIKNQPKLEKETTVLKEFLVQVKNIDDKVLKENLQNSGLLLESKLLNKTLKHNTDIQKDIKAVFLQIQDSIEKTDDVELQKELKPIVEKLLTQLEFYQLYSYSTNSNISYLPFEWEDIEDGDIKIGEDKDKFSCQINLILKEFGEFKSYLQLDKKNNISIDLAVEDDTLKNMIHQNIQLLRKAINSIGLNIESLNIFSIIKGEVKTYEEQAYNSSGSINFGLDIKV